MAVFVYVLNYVILLTISGFIKVSADYEWAVKLNRFTLDFLGLWPKMIQNSWQKLMCNFRVLVTLLGLIGLLIPSIHSLIKIFGDSLLLLDNLQFTLPVISCLIRIIIFWWKREAIIPIMDMIAKDWTKTRSDQERNLMIRRAQTARIIIICSYCIMGMQCFSILVLPVFGLSMRLTPNITDPGRPLPLQSYYIYDITKKLQYELTFINQAIYVVLGMMAYTGIDNFLSFLVFHVCGQLDILKNRLQHLDKQISYHKMLKCCIAKHIRLLRAIDVIEDTYNLILLYLFIYFAILFAFYGFRMISLFDEGNDLSVAHLTYFLSTFNIFIHMCLYCALGEILMAQCNKIYNAAYNSEWYTMDPKIAEDLLLLMIRGSKPIYLTAGKICPVTLATFCSVDFEWAVKLNRFTLNLIGLWPKTAQNSRQRLMCNFRVLVVFLGVTLGLLIPSIHSLTRIFGDIILMLDNLQFTLPTISCSIRILIFWWKKEAIVPIMNMIVEDWVKLKSAQERSVMIRRARSARIIITCAYCIMGAGCFFLIVLPSLGISMRETNNITDPGRPMPLQTHYIYDVTKRPQYELTFISQSIYIIVAMMSYSGIDNFLGLLVFHICGQLDILKNRLTSLDKYMNSHEILKSCVIRHMRLLRAIDIIEDTYNVILLFLFVYFAILFAFYGFRIITLFDGENNISFAHLMYFASTVLNIFAHMCLYCALGEILVAQCNKIYYAAYNNKWYTMNPQITQNLLLLMIRGSKPIYLTAGKVFPVTMATFCSLVKTSVGYISVLHTTRS